LLFFNLFLLAALLPPLSLLLRSSSPLQFSHATPHSPSQHPHPPCSMWLFGLSLLHLLVVVVDPALSPAWLSRTSPPL
jgi:hypothetical protein